MNATGNAEVHIIPQVQGVTLPPPDCVLTNEKVNLGITALGAVGAKVFVNIDGSANAQLSLEAPKTITGGIDPDCEGGTIPQNSTFGGCVEVGTGISVNVGADSSLFGLFDDSVAKKLFVQNFTLFQVSSCTSTRGASHNADVLVRFFVSTEMLWRFRETGPGLYPFRLQGESYKEGKFRLS